ncbi:MAG: HNH endonuclease signature motif containing protein, partial [Mycobacteriales bacterium]
LKATGDPRTVEQLLCDVTLQLLTTGRLDDQAPARFEVTVLTPLSVLHGDDLETGEIPGWGPISAATTRELITQSGSSFTQATVDSDGRVLAVNDPVRTDRVQESARRTQPAECDVQPAECDPRLTDPDRYLRALATAMQQPPTLRDLTRTGYRPSTRLLRLLHARDRTCVFPGCHVPAPRTDADHREPWPHGPTSPDNLQCLCRRHHRAKHTLFTTLEDPDGTTAWITRGGWAFRRPPPL